VEKAKKGALVEDLWRNICPIRKKDKKKKEKRKKELDKRKRSMLHSSTSQEKHDDADLANSDNV